MNTSVSPRAIYDIIAKQVVGQDAAKRAVATAVFLHWVRFYQSHTEGGPKIPLKKSNILLAGPSGTGKTLIVRHAAQALRDITGFNICPTLEVDCTELSSRGWEGEHLSTIIGSLLTQEGQNETSAESAIVFLDEFDKICKPAVGAGGTNHNKLTQYNLLKILEGTTVKSSGHSDRRTLNTHSMLFIFAGNFTEIRDEREKVAKPMGFVAPVTPKRDNDLLVALDRMGLSTQLVGRISTAVELQKLEERDLTEILERFLIPEFESTWAVLKAPFSLSKKVKKQIVQEAAKRGTGARGLHSLLSAYVEDELFDIQLEVK